LTYYTLFSIVPLAALLFGIAKGFSLDKHLQNAIETRAVNHRELLQYISQFAERTLEEASGGVVAGIGVVALLWTVFWLITNIERSFNSVWDLPSGRNWWRKLSNCLSLTLFTPFLLIITGTAGVVSRVVTYSVSLVRGVFNFLIGMIIAVYLLSDSERFISQAAAVCYSLLPKRSADRVIEVANLSGQMLNRFIFGKLLDSLIIGIFCYIMTELLTIPYAPLISFIVGITNMIPVFGPFIGAVPAIFILLIIQPSKALEFAIFIIILQQIDGNIIGPYILGDSMGLPPIWIMFAIIVGGAVGGVLGMFLGVPIFSVIYLLFTRFIKRQLAEKNIKINP
jgi:predicted PurR-regulated permease PerM